MDRSNHKAQIKLIALDLDDTLLRTDLSISQENKSALQRAESMGIHIVLASGRNYFSMRRYAEELSIQRRGDYLIGSNGAQLIQASTGKLLEELKLPAEFCRRVTTQIEQQGFSWQIYIEGTIYCNRMNEWAILDHQLSGLPIEIIYDMDAFLSKDQTKILIGGEPDRIESLYEELKNHIGSQAEIVTSKPYFLEILLKGANKGAALDRLAKRLRLGMESVLAIGDARNDLHMIQRAGWGCAPANAAEEVRLAARFVSTKTNKEDAVADILGQIVFS
ncbi:MAG: Sugar phosphatase YidA [Spirochaetes bacterium ADurb.Bin110]|nr:MAG: Sugar phosphatase YidA [Spirochaetes bacterium ADurb.Bin110]